MFWVYLIVFLFCSVVLCKHSGNFKRYVYSGVYLYNNLTIGFLRLLKPFFLMAQSCTAGNDDLETWKTPELQFMHIFLVFLF